MGMKPLAAEDIANAVIYAVSAPENVQVAEITLLPIHQASASVVYRRT
jgi:hypothetical protein